MNGSPENEPRDPLVTTHSELTATSESTCKKLFCELLLRRDKPSAYEYPKHNKATTTKLRAIIIFIGILPTIAIITLMLIAKLGIVSMFVFHLLIILYPFIYMKLVDEEGIMAPFIFVSNQFTGYAVQARQWKISAALFVVGTSLAFVLTFALSKWCFLVTDMFKPMKQNVEANGVNFTPEGAVLFVLYFTFINSLIEEIFWRGWLLERLGTDFKNILLSGCLYALYHFFVLYAVLPSTIGFNIWGSFVLTMGLIVAGIMFSYIHQIHGIIIGWSVHAVADAGIMFVLIAAYYQDWSPKSCGMISNTTIVPSPSLLRG